MTDYEKELRANTPAEFIRDIGAESVKSSGRIKVLNVGTNVTTIVEYEGKNGKTQSVVLAFDPMVTSHYIELLVSAMEEMQKYVNNEKESNEYA